jgi:hypothetical protein
MTDKVYWIGKCEWCHFSRGFSSKPSPTWECHRSIKPIPMFKVEGCDGPFTYPKCHPKSEDCGP